MTSVRGAASFHACDIVESRDVGADFSLVTDASEARALIASLRDSLRAISAPFEPNPPSDDVLAAQQLSPLFSQLCARYGLDRVDFQRALDNTIAHVFEQARAAVYVLIVNEHLRVFLPLCNVAFRNDWDLQRLQPRASEDARQSGFVSDPRGWWCNAGVICNVAAVAPAPAWSLELLREYRDAIVDALRSVRSRGGSLAWCEFVLNKRDHPLVRADGCAHPYVYGPFASQAVRARAQPLLPFVSPYTQIDGFADLPLPVAADLTRAKDAPGASARLSARIARAVWRGSATGWGLDARTNPRIALARLSLALPDLLDARLVGLNDRDKVDPFTGAMSRAPPAAFSGLDVGRHNFMSQSAQDAYAMQVYVPGHAAASRLGAQLASGAVVLLVGSHPELPLAPHEMWYTRQLKAGVHYVPVQYDLRDLETQIRWVLRNLGDDGAAQRIADAGRAFAERYLTRSYAVEHALPALLEQIAYAESRAFGDGDVALPAETSLADIQTLLRQSAGSE
jgi:hypothetical protein